MDSTSEPVKAVFVTVPNMDTGKAIARHLVKERLAACCNIIPGLTSIYEWEGKIEEDSELLLMIKSAASRVSELTEAVRNMHPYEECEVISVDVTDGSESYLDWVRKTVSQRGLR